jgi:adenosine deaminase/adenosine deaminase CECR1
MQEGQKILKQRAMKENVSYIETMLSRPGAASSDTFNEKESAVLNAALRKNSEPRELTALFDTIASRLDDSNAFNESVQGFVQMVDTVHEGIDDNNFILHYQTYAVRTLPPLQVFTDLYSGFKAADKSPLVVGVNIVAPENHYIALEDYTLHMRMFEYLHRRYPNVNRTLHAGELTLGMVRPKDLFFHINEARHIAHAQRIGHGVDLPWENNSRALLKDLKQNAAVEINLTSNEFILGVEGSEHPYQIYADYGRAAGNFHRRFRRFTE